MTAYELMIKTNRHLINGGTITEKQRGNIVRDLLFAASDENAKQSFYRGVKATTSSDRKMYPEFFIPPYNDGKKLKTVLNQTPQTQILSANMYELEILRLLFLLAPENESVKLMVEKTKQRLKLTCFGSKDDGVGECFDASLVVLRFLSLAAREDLAWQRDRLENYNRHVNDKKRTSFSKWYFWLCLSELPLEIAQSEIEKYSAEMFNFLQNKSLVMNTESEKIIHPVLFSILKNALSRLPEYEHLRGKTSFVSEKDHRLHFDI